jgi:hypothetical protein
MYDSWGDGWNGASANVYDDGELIASGTIATGSVGSFEFTVGVPVITGCIDVDGCNYNPDATLDDGSCTYPDCTGDCDGTAEVDACGICAGDGSACAECANPSYYDDGWCDDGFTNNNTPECGYDGGDCCPGDCLENTGSYTQPSTCESYADCTTCLDPNSADVAEDGDCYDAGWDAVVTGFGATSGGSEVGASVTWAWDALDDGVAFSCPDGEEVLIDCIGTEFCDSDCVGNNYDGCITGESTWINDAYCDDGTWGLVLACAEYNCDGCACATDDGGYSTDGCTDDCNYEAPDTAACAASITIGLADLDADGVIDECYTDADASAYLLFSWAGACLVTSVAGAGYDQDGECDELTGTGCAFAPGDPEDFSAYGFTGGFYWYGHESNYTDYWTLTFTDVSASAEATTGDCAGDDNSGGDDCVDDNNTTDSYGMSCQDNYDMYGYYCYGGYYDDDDFDECAQCCSCEGDAACDPVNGNNSIPVLTMNHDLNERIHHEAIANWKTNNATEVDKTLNHGTPTLINIVTGEVIPGSNESNRSVSYELNVSCDACLGGAPYAGTFASDDNFLTVYGFDTDSEVCGNVVAVSTEYGSTDPSETACALATTDSPPCDLLDCSGQEYCGVESYIGDGYCDDGTWGYYFNCDEFACDGGDCLDDCGVCNGDGSTLCWDGSSVCGDDECPSECLDGDANDDGVINVVDVVTLVNAILSADTASLECADMNADGLINVTDIVSIVNLILGGGALGSNGATEAIIEIASDQLSVRGMDGTVDGVQLTLSHGSNFSIELVNVNQADMEFAAKRSINNTTTMVIVAKKDLSFIGTTTGEYDIISYVVAATDEDGSGIELSTSSTSIIEVVDFKLAAAYPNPFNPTTTLELAIPERGYVSVKVYNLVGQEVATLVDGVMDANPSYTFQWNAGSLSSGVYLVRAEGAGQVTTQKLMLLK